MSSSLDPKIVACFRNATPPYLGTHYVRLAQSIRDEAVADLTAVRDSLWKKCERLDERRHELHDLLTAVEAERDRLQAIVEALRPTAESVVADGNQDDDPYTEGNLSAWAFVLQALRRADGSTEGTDG